MVQHGIYAGVLRTALTATETASSLPKTCSRAVPSAPSRRNRSLAYFLVVARIVMALLDVVAVFVLVVVVVCGDDVESTA